MSKWPIRIAVLMLFALSIIQSFRLMELNDDLIQNRDELIQTKKDLLETDQQLAEFMKSTNSSIHYATEALNNHTDAILHLAGAR